MHSLYRRLTITHTLVALLAVLLVSLLAGGLILRSYQRLATADAARQSRAVAERLRGPLVQLYVANRGWDGAAAQIGQRMEAFGAFDGRLVLVDDRGEVLFDSTGELEGERLPAQLRPAAMPMQVRGRDVGQIVVVPSNEQRAESERAFVRSLVLIVGVGGLIAGGGALLVALLLARGLVRPLRSLTQAAHRLAAGAQHEPIPPPADAELADLANAFNGMAAELSRQEQLRRHMVADIAHELRTPLSVLRLQVESMEDGIVQPTPQTLAALGGELDLLARLVDDLRLLSLADAGQLSLAPVPLDPRQALEQSARAAEARALQRGIALTVDPGPPLPPVLADPQRLAQILGNLIENALRYTPAGGAVTLAALEEAGGQGNLYGRTHVSAPHAGGPTGPPRPHGAPHAGGPTGPPRPHGAPHAGGPTGPPRPHGAPHAGGPTGPPRPHGAPHAGGPTGPPRPHGAPHAGQSAPNALQGRSTIILEVRDSGPGIAEADLPQIFDRFYRADRARARETGGSGLGLAIVQRLVEAQGGSISVRSRLGQGATFRVELPQA